MTPSRRRSTLLVLAAAGAAQLAGQVAGQTARASETGQVMMGQAVMGQVMRIAERCDVYGPGFVDIGNGACGQIVGSDRIRADDARSLDWPAVPGTSNAALRSGDTGPASEGLGMVRGAAGAQHLRIGADPYGH